VFEGHIEEVGSAASGIEDAERAEATMVGGDELEGLGVFFVRLVAEFLRGGSGFLGGDGVSI
jgi:hypothetical protein